MDAKHTAAVEAMYSLATAQGRTVTSIRADFPHRGFVRVSLDRPLGVSGGNSSQYFDIDRHGSIRRVGGMPIRLSRFVEMAAPLEIGR